VGLVNALDGAIRHIDLPVLLESHAFLLVMKQDAYLLKRAMLIHLLSPLLKACDKCGSACQQLCQYRDAVRHRLSLACQAPAASVDCAAGGAGCLSRSAGWRK